MIIGLANQFMFNEGEVQGTLVQSTPMNEEIDIDVVTEENLMKAGFKNVVLSDDNSFFSTTKIDREELIDAGDVIQYFYTTDEL